MAWKAEKSRSNDKSCSRKASGYNIICKIKYTRKGVMRVVYIKIYPVGYKIKEEDSRD